MYVLILLLVGPSIKFMLRGQTYLNNTVVLITDIGEDTNALLCVTDRSDCCSSPNGEFYYPDNTAVGFSNTNPLYRNRGPQVVRLNRRTNTLSPTGVYRCEIPDSSGRMQNIYINVIGEVNTLYQQASCTCNVFQPLLNISLLS